MTGEKVSLIRVREEGRYGCAMEEMTEGRTWWMFVCVGGGYGCVLAVDIGERWW